jgi:hypothetical protein
LTRIEKEPLQIGFITYLVPYLPVTPTFLVLFVILADVAVIDGVDEERDAFDVDFGASLKFHEWPR